jgi:hypothetical protein
LAKCGKGSAKCGPKKGINRTLQIGFGLIGAVLTGILGLFAAQLAAQI